MPDSQAKVVDLPVSHPQPEREMPPELGYDDYAQLHERLDDIRQSVRESIGVLDSRVSSIEGQLGNGDARMQRIEAKQHDMGQSLEKNSEQTSEVWDILQTAKGFFKGINKVGGWINKGARWALPVVSLVSALAGAVWAVKHGAPELGAPPSITITAEPAK